LLLFFQSSCGKFLLLLIFCSSTKKEMLNIKGITEAKVDKLYEIAQKIEA